MATNVNRLGLHARVSELDSLRYTPAGVPALDLRLEHASELFEAGENRRVNLLIKAVAFGALAERLRSQTASCSGSFSGFLANVRNSKAVVFHIQEFLQD